MMTEKMLIAITTVAGTLFLRLLASLSGTPAHPSLPGTPGGGVISVGAECEPQVPLVPFPASGINESQPLPLEASSSCLASSRWACGQWSLRQCRDPSENPEFLVVGGRIQKEALCPPGWAPSPSKHTGNEAQSTGHNAAR